MTTTAVLDANTRTVVLRLLRLIYPHDAVQDHVYAEVLDRALASLSGTSAFHETLMNAEKALNAQQPQRWIDLDEESQIASMKAIDRTDFFATIRGALQTQLYNHSSVWAVLGYDGPSFEKGGYIERGAGVVDWLRRVQ